MNIYGLIGYPLSHSFSKKYFTRKFIEEKRDDCLYENFEMPAIDGLSALLQHTPELKGFNVTIPYKEQIIPYLHAVHPVVDETGACNCTRIENGRLHGFNTDVIGFQQSLEKRLGSHHKKALILGTGGAAKAIAYALRGLQIDYVYVSRGASFKQGTVLRYEEITGILLKEHTLIINTTPLGMFPNEGTAPAIAYDYLTPDHHLFDLVYNPEKTEFLRRGEEMGASIQNGHEMLIIQAEESWKIWNGRV